MLRSIIIEDQSPAQYILQRYIGNTDTVVLEKTFSNAIEAQAYLEKNRIDLVFLDINLPRLSGMDFLRTGTNHPFTILTTAYSEFALESYQYNVVDYLLKPFSFERFSQAIDKVISMTKSLQQVSELTDDNKYVFIKCSHDIVKVDTDDIIFIQSDSDYTEVVTASNKYLTSDALKDWTTKLNDDFKQVHKSFIINRIHLKKISHNKIYLAKDHVVPLGRAFKKQFIEGVVK